jgi:dolichyl-phosphate-mannose-protein mannosyltransferase
LLKPQSWSPSEKILVLAFIFTLPFVNATVQGDGTGYYANLRSLLVDHNLQFKGDWSDPNTAPLIEKVDAEGHVTLSHYTRTGHLANHFSVGPAILWAPFLVPAHLALRALQWLGLSVTADGFSRPYLLVMALSTALYGFLGLWLSFRVARKYFGERWALFATLGVWFATSLPVYMYLEPSWSHAHSAFTVSLFVWYWDRTRQDRSVRQWILLGAIAGLMLNVYYVNAIVLALPLVDFVGVFWKRWQRSEFDVLGKLLVSNFLFLVTILMALLPTLITRKIVYGSFVSLGYTERWFWKSPALLHVLFSGHGLFSVTPILIVALVGLVLFALSDRKKGLSLLLVFCLFLYTIGCYEKWDGVASFGNRFFVSLTPIFVMGLAAAFSSVGRWWEDENEAAWRIAIVLVLLSVWNLGLVVQLSQGLMPEVGPVYWEEIVYNQFRVMPGEAARALAHRFHILG